MENVSIMINMETIIMVVYLNDTCRIIECKYNLPNIKKKNIVVIPKIHLL